ncbi:MAG: hypothetical protein R3Y24_12050 [Eubacteriales bacterium]
MIIEMKISVYDFVFQKEWRNYMVIDENKEEKEIGTSRKNKKVKMTTDEFLSNFGRDNTITPIITLAR